MTLNCWKFIGWKSKRWTVCAIALYSFALDRSLLLVWPTLTR